MDNRLWNTSNEQYLFYYSWTNVPDTLNYACNVNSKWISNWPVRLPSCIGTASSAWCVCVCVCVCVYMYICIYIYLCLKMFNLCFNSVINTNIRFYATLIFNPSSSVLKRVSQCSLQFPRAKWPIWEFSPSRWSVSYSIWSRRTEAWQRRLKPLHLLKPR